MITFLLLGLGALIMIDDLRIFWRIRHKRPPTAKELRVLPSRRSYELQRREIALEEAKIVYDNAVSEALDGLNSEWATIRGISASELETLRRLTPQQYADGQR